MYTLGFNNGSKASPSIHPFNALTTLFVQLWWKWDSVNYQWWSGSSIAVDIQYALNLNQNINIYIFLSTSYMLSQHVTDFVIVLLWISGLELTFYPTQIGNNNRQCSHAASFKPRTWPQHIIRQSCTFYGGKTQISCFIV